MSAGSPGSLPESVSVKAAQTITGAKTFTGVTALTGGVSGDVSLAKEAAHSISIAASTTTDTAGGALTVKAGDGAATNANGGALALDAGAKAGSGTDGAITIGATNAQSVGIGRTGKTTTVAGALAVTQASTLTGNVGIGGAPATSAALTVTSTTQGVLLPRMTATQRDAIATPAAGLLVYNTTSGKLNFYNGSAWEAVTSA